MTRALVLLVSACLGTLCLLGVSFRPDPRQPLAPPPASSPRERAPIEAPPLQSTRAVLVPEPAALDSAPPATSEAALPPAAPVTSAPVATACAPDEVPEDWEQRYRGFPGEDLVRAQFRIARDAEQFPGSPGNCSRRAEIAWLAERAERAPAPTWVRVLSPDSDADDFERVYGFQSAEDLTVEAWRLRRFGEVEREQLFDERFRAGEYEVLSESAAVG
jgi:hypothetical protein